MGDDVFIDEDEDQPPSPSTLVTEVASGNRVRALTAVRDRLAAELLTAEGAAVASVSRELRIVLAELEQLGVRTEVTPLDRLADGVVASLSAYRARGGQAATGS